jgi:DNA mismatch repair protein MutS
MNATPPPGASPMVVAYVVTSAAHPDHLLLYRVGEFYEVLLESAATVSRLLGIQLTRRKQKDAADIPMCGIPASAADGMIARLLAAGRKVAVSEQPVDPSGERPLRLVTPGTSVDANVLASGTPNNLLVCHTEGERVGFAWIDLSTGEAGTYVASLDGCGSALARATPSEILVSRWPEGSEALALAVRSTGIRYSNLSHPSADSGARDAVLAQAYGGGWQDLLRGFSPLELIAHAALLDYVRSTVGALPAALAPPRRATIGDTLEIDAPTLRGLEVLTSQSGRDGSLLSVMDRTVTAPGARLLVRQLSAPLTSPQTIKRRLAMVRCFVDQPSSRLDCREALSGLPDVLRACGRLSLGKGGPRDLAAVREGLRCAATLSAILRRITDPPSGLATVARDLGTASTEDCGSLAETLRRALRPDPPAKPQEGGFIADGFSRSLDADRSEMARATKAIEALQARYGAETGIKGLKVRTNSVIGYHVEVPSSGAQGLGAAFTLRQGLASSSRFSTPELDRLATTLEAASGKVTRSEQAAFNELSVAVLTSRAALGRITSAAAALDLVTGLAQAAAEGLWSEPEMLDNISLEIRDGRHPVADALFNREGRAFVANDCRMGDSDRIWLLTGPNMAGKSTFLRQVALIVLMAQVGSFVPATQARIGVVDKLFSRIGTLDDLVAGRSTFMVEMLETSAILNQATDRSLVILDEVGRGTSTHDGLAIAQACLEYLHDVVRCRTLFATHYHELADTAEALARAICMAMDASEGRHGDAFNYKVSLGRAGKSYGLKVAALAGMPDAVLARASKLLETYARIDTS